VRSKSERDTDSGQHARRRGFSDILRWIIDAVVIDEQVELRRAARGEREAVRRKCEA
jgi:hypothetical protein